MSTDVERRLAEVLARRAEDAMDSTDTQEQLRAFLSRQESRPPRRRRAAVIGATLAAAAVAAAVFWGTALTDDRTGPEPVDDPRPRTVRVAEDFVDAYASGDAESAASFLAPDTEPWDGWRGELVRDEAWKVQYLLEPCEKLYKTVFGTTVVCPFDVHALGSEERGMGPYENGSFTVRVDGGHVVEALLSFNEVNNGLAEHVAEMRDWMKRVYPFDYPLMKRDYEELDADQRVVWTRMWTEHVQKFIETH
jgi:hypothetical protein